MSEFRIGQKRGTRLQREINARAKARKFPWCHTPVDGDAGDGTFRVAGFVARLMGFSDDAVKQVRRGRINERQFYILVGARPRTAAMKRRDQQFRPEAKRLRQLHNAPPENVCWSTWRSPNGVDWRVAGWMVGDATGPYGYGSRTNWLQKSVEHGWSGELYSGGRTPEYSESLCFAICSAPSCQGTCAGRNSNHSGCDGSYPGWGAVDAQDYYKFGDVQREIGSPLKNALPNDRPHFSTTGN